MKCTFFTLFLTSTCLPQNYQIRLSKCTLTYSSFLDLPWDIAFTNNKNCCRYCLFTFGAVLLLPNTAKLDPAENFTGLYGPIYIAHKGSLWMASSFLWNWVVSPPNCDSLKSEKMAKELQTSYFTPVKIQVGNLWILPSTTCISLPESVNGFESSLQQVVILIHQI